MPNIYNLYTLVKNAVRYFPDDGQLCHRPNAFLVETKDLGGNLSDPNLGATICDKNKDYFYSRIWERKGHPSNIEFEWPLVSMFARDSVPTKLFTSKTSINYSMFLFVTDVYKGKDCDGCDCGGCDNRTVNEIYADTQKILFSILAYIGQSGLYLVDDVEGLWHPAHLAFLEDAGKINEYSFIKGLDSSLNVTNGSPLLYHTAPGEDRYGTALRFNIEFKDCNQPVFEFDGTTFAAAYGCKNCG
jgi:hypothetical protein